MIRHPNIPSVVVFRLYTDPNEEVESDRVTSESSTFLARALTFFEDHDQLSKRLSTRPIAGKHQTNVEHLDVTLFTSTLFTSIHFLFTSPLIQNRRSIAGSINALSHPIPNSGKFGSA